MFLRYGWIVAVIRVAQGSGLFEDAAQMSASGMLGVAGLVSWGLGVLVLVAFIVVIATVVRRHRPDATPILLGALIFEVLISLVTYLVQAALPRFMGVSDGSLMEAYALSNVIFSVAHAAARACLLWGIVRLAQPQSR